jgi:parallel beta-helix repeat protein
VGRHDGIFTGHATNVLIQGNISSHNAEHGVYVSNSADGPRILGNASYGNGTCGLQINADGSECPSPPTSDCDGVISNWLMDSNVVYANKIGINLDGAVSGRLVNNYVHDDSNKGVAMYFLDAYEASHDNVVVNNTILETAGPALELVNNGNGAISNIQWSPNNNTIFNNILYSTNNQGLFIDQAINGTAHDYNLLSSMTDNTNGTGLSSHESSPTLSSVL